MTEETIPVMCCYTILDSRVMRIGTWSFVTHNAEVDEVALLLSESMGGPQIHIAHRSVFSERRMLLPGAFTHRTWQVNFLVAIAEDAFVVADFLNEKLEAGTLELPGPGPGNLWRLRGGALEPDLLSHMPVKVH